MLKIRVPRRWRDQKGLASIEMIPIMIVIAILLNFAIGFFGVIHTGILNSIAARNYAFETFRNRSNLTYFHDVREPNSSSNHFRRRNTRVHSIASEKRADSGSTNAIVTLRKIGFNLSPEPGTLNDRGVHEPGAGSDRGVFGIDEGTRNDSVDSAPVWVRPAYGICLNEKCSQ